MQLIETPTGESEEDDPSFFTGRAGFNRPRNANEGVRPVTRYEQRLYAAQLRASPHLEEMRAEVGPPFAHYLRTDPSGARPIRPDLLDAWIERGWLERATVPSWEPPPTRPAIVLDPFAGSGTTLMVAEELGRWWIGIDICGDYLPQIQRRTAQRSLAAAFDNASH